MCKFVGKSIWANFMLTEQKWNFKVVFNRSCCHGNYENVKFYLSVKIFRQYIFHLPSFSSWAATFLLPSFRKWHILTNCQSCVQPPERFTIGFMNTWNPMMLPLKKTYLGLFLLKGFYKKVWDFFFSKIDSDCYFIERIKHPLFKFTSQSCLVTFFRLSNSNSYLSSRYIYTWYSHSMNVDLRNWYIILVTYLVPEHNVKNFHCKFKVMSHMVRKMFLTWY